MKQTTMDPRTALDKIVCHWVQAFEDVNFRIEATHHFDKDSGDEFITVYDPLNDTCLTAWVSKAWYGNDVLNLANTVIRENLHPANSMAIVKGGRQ